MPTPTASEVVKAAIAAGDRPPEMDGPVSSKDAVHMQAALVRALSEELDLSNPSDRGVSPLRHQLADELAMLACTVAGVPESSFPELVAPDPEAVVDVLVVDDELAACRTAVRVLERMGYPCRSAMSAEEALRMYHAQPAAIVLTDWCMPEMSGLELCAELKRQPSPPYVILVTAYHEKGRLLDVVAGGADDFVKKPMDLGELEARLYAAARLIRSLRAASRICSTPPPPL
jgi:CheY-like chemotaxis protein